MARLGRTGFVAVILSMLLVSHGLLAAPKNPSLELLNRQVKDQEKLITSIKGQIQSIEEQLTSGNKRYLTLVDQMTEAEYQLEELVKAEEMIREKIEQKLSDSRQVLTRQVLTRLNSGGEAAVLLADKILTQKLAHEIQELEAQLEISQKNRAAIEQIRKNYGEFQTHQIEIASVLNEMEWQKKTIVSQYVEENTKKQDLVSRYDRVRAQFVRSQARADERVTSLRFGAPINDYLKLDYGDKGVSFEYKGRQPVLSTQSGDVVYSGELSTFGNVVMIDHGQDTRSVILGDFIPTLEKGSRVKLGDVIGYTTDRLNSGSVYFEVRNNNNVQNTITLMDSRFIESQSLARR
jgi:murein DD-endopeptidase MepM/ murein hydrolase activator NlpD